MVYICKDNCRLDRLKMSMFNIKPSLAYIFCNRCSICSDSCISVWYLKWVKDCPCCGSTLRRKSKHSEGRKKVTLYNKTHKLV